MSWQPHPLEVPPARISWRAYLRAIFLGRVR
jgi:hypothetical protein